MTLYINYYTIISKRGFLKKINPHIYNRKRIILDMNAMFIEYTDISLTCELILMDEIFSTIGREIYKLLKDLRGAVRKM